MKQICLGAPILPDYLQNQHWPQWENAFLSRVAQESGRLMSSLENRGRKGVLVMVTAKAPCSPKSSRRQVAQQEAKLLSHEVLGVSCQGCKTQGLQSSLPGCPAVSHSTEEPASIWGQEAGPYSLLLLV
jgi:hypothetical protein